MSSQKMSDSQEVREQTEFKINRLVEDNIGVFLEECETLISKQEAPFLPMTFTLWRQVAIKRLK